MYKCHIIVGEGVSHFQGKNFHKSVKSKTLWKKILSTNASVLVMLSLHCQKLSNSQVSHYIIQQHRARPSILHIQLGLTYMTLYIIISESYILPQMLEEEYCCLEVDRR